MQTQALGLLEEEEITRHSSQTREGNQIRCGAGTWGISETGKRASEIQTTSFQRARSLPKENKGIQKDTTAVPQGGFPTGTGKKDEKKNEEKRLLTVPPKKNKNKKGDRAKTKKKGGGSPNNQKKKKKKKNPRV